jgi:FkbM family methyltransferase
MLPTLCKLYRLGADLRWRENDLEVSFNDMVFVSPADNRLLPLELDGILNKDHWRIRESPILGKTAVDIGSHIGVFAVACAKAGALVHAFEPFAGFRKYIDINKTLNFVGEKIVIHAVGLSNKNECICSSHDLESMASYTHGKDMIASEHKVEVVDAVSYFQANSITDIELMKMNCEGCEYDLISPQLLKAVNPNRISLEFHNGVAELADIHTRSGMYVEADASKHQGKGNLFARKISTL